MKIDFVITWVDGNDPNWKIEKEHYSQIQTESRFRDWNLLKFWFRGVEKYAPWVNQIHFVTWGHIPDFLNVDHPKLNIVKHEDFISPKYLPTFNSNAIELNLHRIENLEEHFVYFNDDVFLINPVKPSDFFEEKKPKDVAILNPIVAKNTDSISNVMLNNMGIINKHFELKESIKKNPNKWFNIKYGSLNMLNMMFIIWGSAVGLLQQHLTSSFVKSKMSEVWSKEFELLHETSKRKFRDNKRDVNQWVFKKWMIMQGYFMPRKVNFGKYLMIRSIEDLKGFEAVMKKQKIKVICLNDHVEDNFDLIIKKTHDIFNATLKDKSQFES